jgi:hypothetical protein
MSAGCGTRVGPDGDPNETPAPSKPPATTAPSTGSATPSAVPTVPPAPTPAPAQLQASQKEFKKQLLGWFEKPWVEVMVTNPGSTTASGMLRISFTKGSTPTGDDQEKEVTLGGGETQTLKFSAKKGNPDAATINITTNQSAAPAPDPGARFRR